MKIDKKIIKVVASESKKFTNENGYKLNSVFEILDRNGINTKSTYSLPLKDTIGKVYFDQVQFSIK